jgi:hypothetical protein
MADLGGFDATKIAPQGDRTPLPAGEYKAVIEKSEKKPTQKGTGFYLELVIKVVDGEHAGRMVWDRLNIWNPNQTAAQIAAATLSSICHATGVMKPNASEQLHNIPMIVSVVVKERDDKKGEFGNEVKGYKRIGAREVAKNLQVPETVPSSQAEKAPWEG